MTDTRTSAGLPFMKMHGLGNDFVVIDARAQAGAAMQDASVIRALADRHRGVGFDQLVVIVPEGGAGGGGAGDGGAGDGGAAAALRFFNADGSPSGACGNATRCVARHLMDVAGVGALALRTARGLLACEDAGGGWTRVNMGAPLTGWREVPLARAVDTLHLPIAGDPVATGMGNPHCTFIVAEAAAVDLATFGPAIEHHPLFPERTNVEVVELRGRDAIRLRIWERGAGVTLASGSCACAAAVACARRGLTARRVAVEVDGGALEIDWRDDGVWMAGPTAHVFDGVLAPAFLAALRPGAAA